MVTGDNSLDVSLLCVDDEEHNRKIIGLMLANTVKTLHFAHNGKEGLDVFHECRPDIVITDIMMPVMSGLEMTRHIRQHDPKANVIVTTAFSSIACLTESIDVGINQFVAKPISPQSLRKAVRHCYDSIAAERMLREQHSRISLLSSALEESPAAVAIINEQSAIVYVNRKFIELTGWRAHELVGEDIRTAQPLQGVSVSWEQSWLAATEGATWQAEIQYPRKGDDCYWGRTKLTRFSTGATTESKFLLMIEDITDQKRFEEELQYLANHDALTGLYNRGFFEDQLKRLASGRSFPVSIIVADIDGLKQVNDTHGHEAGDRLIRHAAQQLLESFRAEDIVARIGGDEFAILLPGADEQVVHKICRRFLHCQKHDDGSDGELTVRLSIGSATAYSGLELNRSVKLADERMYREKQQRKNHHGDHPLL